MAHQDSQALTARVREARSWGPYAPAAYVPHRRAALAGHGTAAGQAAVTSHRMRHAQLRYFPKSNL